MEEYHYEIRHITGKNNILADHLSRVHDTKNIPTKLNFVKEIKELKI